MDGDDAECLERVVVDVFLVEYHRPVTGGNDKRDRNGEGIEEREDKSGIAVMFTLRDMVDPVDELLPEGAAVVDVTFRAIDGVNVPLLKDSPILEYQKKYISLFRNKKERASE